MPRYFQRLLFTLAGATEDDLRRQIQFLKAENEMLRTRVPTKIIRLTPAERSRLLRLGRPLGTAIRDLITIVHHRTFARWRGSRRLGPPTPRSPGRPRTPEAVRQLVVRIAGETGWGYTRILGELKKLGIRCVSRTTVVNILRAHGFDPGSKRGEGTWDEFVKIHASTLWQCDFVAKRIMTWHGWRDAYLIIFINVLSRRAWASSCTLHPTREWSGVQAERFCRQHENDPNAPRMVMHDRDAKFFGSFRAVLKQRGLTPKALQHCSPNLNAYAERFVQTLQQECLDHFVLFGRRHLDYVVSEFVDYYSTKRPHQAVGNRPLTPSGSPSDRASPNAGEVVCEERLGGLLRHYYRAAA